MGHCRTGEVWEHDQGLLQVITSKHQHAKPRDAAAAFVVFDLTRIATFEAAAKWKDDLDMKVQTLITDEKAVQVVTADGSRVPAVLLVSSR